MKGYKISLARTLDAITFVSNLLLLLHLTSVTGEVGDSGIGQAMNEVEPHSGGNAGASGQRGRSCKLHSPAKVSRFQRLGKLVGTDKVDPHHGFHNVYPRYLDYLRWQPIKLLEIGFYKGSSIKLWMQYLRKAKIVSMDKMCVKGKEVCRGRMSTPHTQVLSSEELRRFSFHHKDQTIESDNADVCEKDGPFDVIIDDGAHTMVSIRTSLKVLLSCVKPGGYYIVEDLHTAYQAEYGGGFRSEDSVMNIFKEMMDVVNNRAFNKSYSVVPGDDRVSAVSCFPQICVVEITKG
ncbi:hypothetical protein CYMTET_56547 [Cymbomonas tetramitiformis]|uniref:Uncharacterized protein n=1 Tax=Cymbomonas tetramitiformis TaxID=36881 RepID=A0AAE0ENM6_9CHLO|nr:hypothetical protein CYMTET_56547 [Cymbomonas tetramitiformis]